MSNALAIATVMGALSTRVQGLLNDAGLNGFDVSTGHPRPNPDSGVYLTLYQLLPHAGMRNADLPTRSGGGDTRARPSLALTLRILFSFVGDAAALEPERLAGLVLADLHARPVIGPDEIEGYLGTLAAASPLRASDLARQPERVRLSPVMLDSEELSRIWGLFGQNSFAPSMAWEASVVLLDGAAIPGLGLPVADVGLAVVPTTPPRVTRLYAATTRQPVVETTDTLVIEGSGLLAANTTLTVGEVTRTLGPNDMQDGRLRVAVSSLPGLRAGVHPVSITHRTVVEGAAGDGVRGGATSNAMALMVRPVLGAITPGAVPGGVTVTLATTPVVEPDQGAELVLADGTARRLADTFTRNGDDIVFTLPGLPAGIYTVRLTIDGAPTMPPMVGGVYAEPTVTVP